MTRKPFRHTARRRRLKPAALALIAAVIMPSAGYAAYAVIDAGAIVKMTEQLSAAKEQIEELGQQTKWLGTLSQQTQKQIDAVGSMGRITLSDVGLKALSSRILRDAQCLKPDFSKLMPSLDLNELQFDSICSGADVYDEALWFDPNDLAEADDWDDGASDRDKWGRQAKAREAVEARRQAITRDATTKGLAQADLAAGETAEANESAIQELAGAATSAETEQARLAVIANGVVLLNRQQAQTNQLLAQLLKVNSASLMAVTTSSYDVPPETAEGGGE